MTPSQLEQLPVQIQILIRELEIDIMDDIVKMVDVNGHLTRTADYELNRIKDLGASSTYIKQALEKYLNKTALEVDKLYSNIISEDWTRYRDLYSHQGIEFTPYEDNLWLQQLVSAYKQQTNNTIRNITNSLGFVDSQGKATQLAVYYQNVLDSANFKIMSGTYGVDRVLKDTVKELVKSGLRYVDYASGHRDTVEVATRRAIMTSVTELTGIMNDKNAENLNTDYFEISWHATARPTHQVWQGRVYSRDELVSVCGLGTVTGLCGINCYHSYYPFIKGVSIRNYTDEELDEMNAKENTSIAYGGKEYTKYEATQMMRKLENKMRKQRQLIHLTNVANLDATADRALYRGTMAEYVRFAKAMDLPQERERIYMDNLGRV